MKAKDFLNQAYLLDQRIRSKAVQIESLNELATSCTSVMTGMPHNPSKSQSPMADAVTKIVDLQREISADMNKLVETKKAIFEVIRMVDDVELRTLLEQRYLCSSTWEEISIALDKKMRWTFILHDKALDAVQNILDKNFQGVQ